MPVPGYETLPHTTDAYLQATGANFEEALGYAAMALFDTMCDVNSISPNQVDNLKVTGADEVSLLYNWLESLLLQFELQRRVYSKFNVTITRKTPNELEVNAKVYGEPYDRRKHGAKVEVKAVTYHKMEVTREDSMTVLRFILDL
jgi:SHS2 domain-containing protein